MILTREELEERLAALHRASLELVQDISLSSLLERIAYTACEQVNARYAAVGVLDENGALSQFIPIGMTPEEIKGMSHPPVGLGLIGVLMHSAESLRLADISADPRSAGFPEGHPPMKTLLGVPIRSGDQQLGQIYLTEKKDGEEFTADDQQVIETLAAYAAVAISNARLYKKLSKREKELTQRNADLAQLNDLASTLASSPDKNEIMEKSLACAVDYLSVDIGEFYICEDDRLILKRGLHRGKDELPIFTREEFAFSEGLPGKCARTARPQVVSIVNGKTRYVNKDLLQAGYQQVACFPMTAQRGVVGVLCVATRQVKPLNEMDTTLLSSIALWAATALENVRLNLQDRRLAVLEERERIGMDLHDGIIQSIYAVGLTLEHSRLLMTEDPVQSKKRIDQAIDDLNAVIRDIRAYILDLRPRQLHEERLIDGLQRLVAEFRANTFVETTLQGPPDGEVLHITDASAIALFHISQEALANIAKHARAHKVEIWLWSSNDRVLLEIRDDGKGFDTQKVNLTLGHGLSNMQTRVHNVGGEVELTSEPGEGTTILAWVPVIQNQKASRG
jgi:signal transduction histidine kinase